MTALTSLPIELQTRILLFTPFTTHLIASKVCKLWSEIISTVILQKARYVPTFTTTGLPNLHRLLDYNQNFKFTLRNGRVIAHKFCQVIDAPHSRKGGSKKKVNYTKAEWIDITDHPFLNEPLLSPFVIYPSRKESDELSYGPREHIILSNFTLQMNVPSSHPEWISIRNMGPIDWTARKDTKVQDLINLFAKIYGVDDDDEVYDVVFSHGWRIWSKKWFGTITGWIRVLPAPEHRPTN
ncbi:hypothetical protein TWF481_012275 [Arthrobotrys musiformis]|uniref:F-box domain-containing protein n=1 Tax=Arthrobotrys musiformis TaxID=47236 RepID=A0AAV9VZ04_9PEZI